MKIRRATTDDAGSLARVHVDAWRSAYRGLVPDERLANLSYARSEERFRCSLVEGAEETYVAGEAAEAVGFVTLGACHDADVDQETTGEICCIYLAPTHWRKGLGTLLCRFAEETLRTRGYGTVTLWVFAGNVRGTCFYEAMGYVADGATKVLDVGAPLEVVRYHRALLGARR
jgi:ribosomal protein S18 acetylase RimI-like enzyme